MATVEKRGNSYRITVSCGYDIRGKQIRKSMTYTPEKYMTSKQIEKEVNRQAVLFEEKCLSGQVLDENIRFSEFAELWIKDRKKDLRPRTIARYESMLPRINQAIGHLKLSKIQPPHLRAFYNNLAEGGIRLDTKYKCNIDLDKYLKDNKMTTAKLSRVSGISNTTIISIRKGNNVTAVNAEKLSNALNMPLNSLFTPVGGMDKTLSGKTILHHHRLISAILHTAVQWGVLFSNPCDRTQPPKAEEKEAKYIDEVQSETLLNLLDNEKVDFTHRTIIRLLLFTGLRRGEVLGLKWCDVDFANSTLTVERTLQYLPDKGIFEGKTKTKSSERTMKLPQIAVEDLRQHRVKQLEQKLMVGDRWQDKGYIFTNTEGEPLKPDSVSSWFSKFINAHPEKLPPITLHSLRHTNATIQIAIGVPITTVSKRLGHTNTSTTGRIYAHAIKSADDNSAEMLNALFSKDTQTHTA